MEITVEVDIDKVLKQVEVTEMFKYIELHEAVDFIYTFDEGVDCVIDELGVKTHETTISKLITFDNCNEVARAIYLQDAEVAKGLYEELKYWLQAKATK